MIKSSFIFFRTLLWLWDLISLNMVMLFASIAIFRADAINTREYHLLFAVFNLIWMTSVYLTQLYMSKNWLDFDLFFKRTFKCYVFTTAVLLFFIFIYHYQYSRFFIIFCLTGFATILLFNRVVFNLLVISLRGKFRLAKNVIILGYNDVSKRLINYFQKEAKLVKLAGCFDDKGKIEDSKELKVFKDLKECMNFVDKNEVTEIYSTLVPEQYPYLFELAKEAEKQFVYFKFVPDYHIFVNRNIYVDFLNDIPVLSLRKEPLEDTGNRIKKRAVDIILSIFVIIFILSWLVPLLAILIKLDSRGPVFFMQLRSGKSNKPFHCLKFRSLQVNNESDSKQVSRNDARITKLGGILRKTNIDELPQFFNIFLGDMSVVGPRPHMLKHTEHFAELYKEYMIRHFVKPGLTGWAQVNGYRGEIKENELLRKRVEFDTWYMENWSLYLDMRIILLTILVTITGDKNAF
jgi:putative colanic acid biosysnthesis UDP-glucose lipid carrier transferase